MSVPLLHHSTTHSVDLKLYYSGSSISRIPTEPLNKPQSSCATLPRIQITDISKNNQLYHQVFLSPSRHNPVAKTPQFKLKRSVHRSSDFFYQLLFADTPIFNYPLQDLLYIAELGIPQGDLRKEANICISLGDKYHHLKKNISAIKFYKRGLRNFIKLKDLEGQSVCYNRLGIAYFVKGKLVKALRVTKKHQGICNEDFVPIYNKGILHRAMGQVKSSLNCFMSSISVAIEKDNKEEICIANAQLALTYKAMEEFDLANLTFKKASKLAKNLKAFDLMAEIKIALAYLNYFKGRIFECKKYFYSGMISAGGKKSEICRINLGILNGEEKIKESYNSYHKK